MRIEYQLSRTHYPALDGIRGAAILLVILFHCFRFGYGWIGVDLFFVLSGFLITSQLLDSKEDPEYFKKFYLKRILRIFPLYYVMLILVLLPKLVFNINTIGEPLWQYWVYLHNSYFAANGSFPKGHGTLNHFWSLAIEEQFYVMFPFIVKWLDTKALKTAIISFLVLVISYRIYSTSQGWAINAYVNTFCRMDGLLIGSFLAIIIREISNVQMLWIVYYFISYLVFAFISPSSFKDPAWTTFGYTFSSLVAMGLILVVLSEDNKIKAFFNNAFLRNLGKYSYGLYVFHPIVYLIFKEQIEPLIVVDSQYINILKTAVSVLTFGITYGIAYLSFEYFEKRMVGLRYRLIKQ